MIPANQAVLSTLGELADGIVEQSGPIKDFVYIDIGSIDRESKTISHPKVLALSEAPSRARQVLKAGDVLISMTRPNLNAVALVTEALDGAIGSTGFHVIRSSWLNPRYVHALVQSQSFIDAMTAVVQGALYPAIRPRDIESFPLLFQGPAQQERIVAKLEELLSELDAGTAELKSAQKKLALYRQSLLKAAVEGALTDEWRMQNAPDETGAELLARILRERRARWESAQVEKFKAQRKAPPKDWQKKYPEPVKPNTSDLPQLPNNWVWASLDMLGEIASGVAKGTKQATSISVREVPYLRVANVQRGYLDLSEIKTILATERDIEALTLVDGDVLFNEGGDRDKLGRGWVWRGEIGNCIHQNHVFRMRPYLPELQAELLSHHGNSFGKLWFQNAGKQTTNLASINMTVLRSFPVPVAPPSEQVEVLQRIRSQLDLLDRQEAATELALKQSVAQRQNILRAAFAGQLVPQDPADEPAAVLLRRIRDKQADRESPPKQPRTQRQKEIAIVSSKLIDVLAEADDWVEAQEAFRRCGVSDGATTEQVEALYIELRALDKAGRLAVEAVADAQGRKLHDRLKLLVA